MASMVAKSAKRAAFNKSSTVAMPDFGISGSLGGSLKLASGRNVFDAYAEHNTPDDHSSLASHRRSKAGSMLSPAKSRRSSNMGK